ncbi:hypothetical protein LVJ83_05705 [Uruburuella testudinis]|uniref:Uncharacterized protein n=1 Tax=Uruburuella testudinis TaxID=1282863 RepID=A0ABY4DV88_9NEIS|nr:hypothetical protein [Uruburuella testudinis]UOO82955.1 hypothetical protein LVJ83_05705 [Uruburuella testudinis]
MKVKIKHGSRAETEHTHIDGYVFYDVEKILKFDSGLIPIHQNNLTALKRQANRPHTGCTAFGPLPCWFIVVNGDKSLCCIKNQRAGRQAEGHTVAKTALLPLDCRDFALGAR